MVEIKINNQLINVKEGTTVLKAAESLGVIIPTMCFMDGFSNHPSCMVCVVKDNKSGKLFPSCAMLVEEGMDIICDDQEVNEARKEALELLLSDHVGDCEAPCRLSCPAFMDIPKMNRLIADNKFEEALKLVKEDIALPLILGYICSAPCEGACRRKQVDNPVSICLLKRFVADVDIKKESVYLPEKKSKTNKKVAVVGSGVAGLACAFHVLKEGHDCYIFDKNNKPGGTLLNISEDELPEKALNDEIEIIKQFGAKFRLNTNITPEIFENELKKDFDTIVFATGDVDNSNLREFNLEFGKSGINTIEGTYATTIEGVFACGSALRHHKLAIRALAQGKEAAFSVNSFLAGNGSKETKRLFNSRFGKLTEIEIEEYKKESVLDDRTEPQKGKLNGFNKEEAILEAKRCLRCDCRKPKSCKLRIYAEEYDANQKKYSFGERKQIKKYLQHKEVVYESEKCIKCGLCIEIATSEKELTGLTYIGRGFSVKIDIPFNKTLSEALTVAAGKCVDACPTGALAFKKGE
ncbi:MAG: (2Fe-2S)-binding protein [Bacteroidales bacterium]|nr:(2Fe-2S)-binding protein [Bacteroidales bacterium]